MPHLFVSYAKADTRELALSLSDKLNAIEGMTAWVDRSLRAGKAWELQIQSEIDRCDVMIVLYSPDINRHKQGKEQSYVLTEIAYAKWTAKKQIIPVMAQRTDPPISLTMEQYIDFTLNGLTTDDLVTAICDELGVVIQQPVSKMSSLDDPSRYQLIALNELISFLDSNPIYIKTLERDRRHKLLRFHSMLKKFPNYKPNSIEEIVSPTPATPSKPTVHELNTQLRYKKGMRLHHENFGEGIVTESQLHGEDEIVTVTFENYGVKRLAASVAKMSIVEEPSKHQPKPQSQYKSGMRVRHHIFGEGIVIENDANDNDGEVTVVFITHGVKRLTASVARLTIVK